MTGTLTAVQDEQARVRYPRPKRRTPTTANASKLAWGIAAMLFLFYSALAVRDQQRMITGGFDRGIFDETVRAYAHGQLPYAALKGAHFNELGDHFSPILALLAPVYLLFPTVYILLIAQAALFALGAVPLVRWAAQETSCGTAVAVGLAYGLSWGIASAAGFDVHEVAFAVPMLSYSATALAHRRWRMAVAWGLPLLLVKEDLGITLAAIGFYIACHGARRLGIATAMTGVLGTVLEVKVIIPAFNPAGVYTYSGSTTGAFNGGIVGLPATVLHFITPETKTVTVVLMLAVTGFFAVRSPITLLVIPTLGWRLLSDNHAYWGTSYQYSAVLMPIVFAGFTDALARLRASERPDTAELTRSAVITSLAVTAMLLPDFPLWSLAEASTWHTNPRVAAAHQIMAEIPNDTTVATGNRLAPQLTDHDAVSLLTPQTPGSHPAWILIDTENPDDFPLAPGQQTQIISELRSDGYRTVADRDGYLLLAR